MSSNNSPNKNVAAETGDIQALQQQLDARQQQLTRKASSSTASVKPRRPSEASADVVSREIKSMQQTISELRTQNDNLQKNLLQTTAKLDKEIAAKRDLENVSKANEAQIALLKRELHVNQRTVPKGKTDDSDALRKAREEIAMLKAKLADEAPSNAEKQVQTLEAENRRLEAQRFEFINCIRKQNKLIDVLKRQKLHLEAAKLLQLSEQEFSKTMECHELQ